MKTVEPKVIRFFSALADETRLNILAAISKGPTSVSEIHNELGDVTISAISHQLRLMSDLGMVVQTKKGRERLYRLSHNYCWCILEDAFAQIKSEKECKKCANIEQKGGIIIT